MLSIVDGAKPRPALFVWIGALAIAATVFSFTFYFIRNLHESTLRAAEADLTRHSLTLAEQADRSFKSLDLVVASVAEHATRLGAKGRKAFVQGLTSKEVHETLQEKLSGLPQVDAITIIDEDGKLLNFSRYWPIPDVNVSDRDYFKALKTDPERSTFVSVPVRNRGTGTWTIYLARRMNGPDGEFIGLTLGAMTLKYFEDFYGATSLGPDSAVSLMREDGTMLVRHPSTLEVGKVFSNAPRILGAERHGLVRELSPIDQKMRIKSAHRLANFPLFILVTQTQDSILASWREMQQLLLGLSLGLSLLLLLAAGMIGRWWRLSSERASADKARAEAQAELMREREKAAEAASKAKTSFLAVMSHEIRTPMNAVLGLTTSLLDTELTPEQRSLLKTIHDSGDSLLEILNDILDYSKLEAGELVFEHITFAPREISQAAVDIIGPRAAAKGLSLAVEADPALPHGLVGDTGRLRQVLINLVSNAVKFTAAGRVAVTCRLIASGPAHAEVEWAVSDTGIGIAPDKIGTLFRDFVQADSSINRRFGGSGLGLSICKRIVDAMDGRIGVVSELGKGTTVRFSVKLPVAAAEALPNDPVAGAGDELAAQIAQLGRPLRVLIADDNPTNRLVASKMLVGLEAQIVTAADGVEAVNAAKQFAFDVILMDVRMPEMDGLEATRAIRRLGSTVPIIAFTANAFEDDVEATRSAGMSDFVAKPVRKPQLLAAIARCFGRQLSQRESRQCRSPAPASATCPEPEAPHFDSRPLDTLASDLGDAVDEAVAAFHQEMRERIAHLRSLGLNEQTRPQIAREAHTIKGSAATFGFMRCSEIARWLERNSPELTAEELPRVVDLMHDAYQSGRAAASQSRAA